MHIHSYRTYHNIYLVCKTEQEQVLDLFWVCQRGAASIVVYQLVEILD